MEVIIMINVNLKLRNELRNVKEYSDIDSYLYVLKFTPRKILDKMFDLAAESVLDSIEVFLVIRPKTEKQKLKEAHKYLEDKIAECSGTKAETYALCLSEVLDIEKYERLQDDINSVLATENSECLRADELTSFVELLRKTILEPYYEATKLRLLGRLFEDPKYTDIGMLMIEYFTEPQVLVEYDDEGSEMNEIIDFLSIATN